MPEKKKAKKKVVLKKETKKATQKVNKKKVVEKKVAVKEVVLKKAPPKENSTVERPTKITAARSAKGGAVVIDVASEKKDGPESYSIVIRGGKPVKVLDSDNPDLF